MAMTLQNVWDEWNSFVRLDNTDITTRKMIAVNSGMLHCMDMLFKHGQLPRDLLSVASGLDIVKGNQSISLPSNYYMYERIAVKSSVDTWLNIPSSAIISLTELMNRLASSFYDSSTTGTPTLLAVQDTTSLYFNVYSDNYDVIVVTGGSGNYTVGETITGSSSGATATVATWTVSTLTLTITESTITDTFVVGETVVGGTSGASRTIDTDGLKYEDGIKLTYFKRPSNSYTISSDFSTVLEFGDNWKTVLATAIASYWLFMENSSEAESKEATLIDLCQTKGIIHNPGRLQMGRNV